MKPRGPKDDVLVGLFVLVAAATLLIGTFWLAGQPLGGSQQVTRHVAMKDAGGLRAGDEVRSAGVKVGRINRVRLRPGHRLPVLLEISLPLDVALRADAHAYQSTAGLLGAPFLQIEPGELEEPLAADAEIPGAAGQSMDAALSRVNELSVKVIDLVDETNRLVSQINEKAGPLLERIGSMLSEENAAHVTAILADLHRTMDTTMPRLEVTMDRLESIVGNVDEGLQDLPAIMGSVQRLTADLEASLGPDGERLTRLLVAGEEGLVAARDTLGVVGENRLQIEQTLHDLQQTVANLREFSQQVKEHPYSLVRIKNLPDRRPGDGVQRERP
ncbi:MAG: MlaD family protein [Acidobacteria bacterium]|nr:MlaD family protein [Acidobacteriota bacterium]